ncbi:phosphotransferase family protein [Actinacidiphila sp. ITFR-21]|uniref:phosphotransferase family protein n=1 Tax=Actinacidiphila sp. ITFR-21 TaxID=3075199 RepID=UPI00288C2554|nr:phosphotransferase [Streptomyces sp. ITFR-21]WNI19720.1 phosphotransferase [Streptomyces sp. ITFR-21]
MWRLPGRVVVRIARPGQEAAAACEAAVARWLGGQGLPAVSPLAIGQPVVVSGRAVTFWHELPEHRQGSAADLCVLLRQPHGLPLPDEDRLGLAVGLLDPFVRTRDRIEAAEAMPESGRAFLPGERERLRAGWDTLSADWPVRLIHGDAWRGNCAVTDDGRRCLLDCERTSVGPPAWDLTS